MNIKVQNKDKKSKYEDSFKSYFGKLEKCNNF